MCGIVGILHRDMQRPVDGEILGRMTDLMSYRGPDDRGIYVSGHLGLGHRRLSIIDLASGQQPMIDGERSRVISYNGEIYNYRSIRNSALIPRGIRLHTSSDTEVLLQLADLDNLNWLESLNGMFAFALWEEKTKRLLLARDRLGVKPLYYVDLGSSLVFASEIKPLLLFPGVQRKVNDNKIAEYLAFRSVAGDETFFHGIRELPPGHVMILGPDDYHAKISRFWREGIDFTTSKYAAANKSHEEQFMDIFSDAVNSRLVSDVPVGTFNSGGVDSSLVTAIVRSFKADDLHTFSVGFQESSHDESRFANIVSQRYKTNHHALIISQKDYTAELCRTVWHLEEPINHPHTVQLLLLSRLAKEFVTVVLTGEGADEVFGGYPRYNIAKLRALMNFAPEFAAKGLARILAQVGGRRAAKLARGFGKKEPDQAIINSMFVSTCDVSRLAPQGIDFRSREELYNSRFVSDGDPINRLLYYDQRTYLPSLLTRLDRTSMAASIEGRVPFLDYRLVEWSYKLNSDVKIRGLTNKWIVKKAAERWLPKEIIYRKKFGFDVPVGQWLRNKDGLGSHLDLLREPEFLKRGYFDSKAVCTLIREHLRGDADHTETLWGLVGFEIWHRLFIDSRIEEISTFSGKNNVACPT
jgi:asparagine synthase (glutamine-hydrolysing)